MEILINDLLNGNLPPIQEIVSTLIDQGDISKYNPRLLFLISLVLEKYSLNEEDKKVIKQLETEMFHFGLEESQQYFIYPARQLEYNEGFFTNNPDEVLPTNIIHHNQHITDDVLLLTEVYYTNKVGVKYREVVFPEGYTDPGFLLDNSILPERENNLKKLSMDETMFEL